MAIYAVVDSVILNPLPYPESDELVWMDNAGPGVDAPEGLGFTPGGFDPEEELWLEDVTVANLGESAVVGAIWYFGSRANRAAAGRGPLTMVLVRTSSGFRISHVNFGNYRPEAR